MEKERGEGESIKKKKVGKKFYRYFYMLMTISWEKLLPPYRKIESFFSVNTISGCGNNTSVRIFILFSILFSLLSYSSAFPIISFFLLVPIEFSVLHRKFQVQGTIFGFDHFYFNEILEWQLKSRYYIDDMTEWMSEVE